MPKQLRRFRRSLIMLTFALQVTVPVAVALAKKKAAAAGPETKEAWVVSYVLVLLSMGLGLYVICRAGTRQ